VIRRAVTEDVVAIATLFRRSFGTLTFLPTLHTADEDRVFFGTVVQDDEVWVWVEDSRVLGFVAVGEVMVDHLYVEPGEHGRGIGTALLARAKERRPQRLQLWTFQQNDRARRFYEHHGFRVVTMTDGSANEERTPDVFYEWSTP
jgi:GNAT superfamily N-acetyltransferase